MENKKAVLWGLLWKLPLIVNAQKRSLLLRIPLVYVNKSAVSCEIPIVK